MVPLIQVLVTGGEAVKLCHACAHIHIGEFFQGGFFGMKVVTFFATLRADLEDYFKCRR